MVKEYTGGEKERGRGGERREVERERPRRKHNGTSDL